MGGAVGGEGPVVLILPAAAAGEGDVGGTKVGAVEDDDAVVVEELHVHGRDADAGLEERPSAAGGIGDVRKETGEVEKVDEKKRPVVRIRRRQYSREG